MFDVVETWADIPGWVGRYQASSLGRIRSLQMQTAAGVRRGRILKPWPITGGYLQVHLSLNGKRRARPVHQLVLESFVGARPEGAEACHGDADRQNNSVWNLRWDSISENRKDITRAGNSVQANKEKCNRGHKLSGENLVVSKKGWRSCLACKRAHSYSRNVLGTEISQELADEYYRKVMAA